MFISSFMGFIFSLQFSFCLFLLKLGLETLGVGFFVVVCCQWSEMDPSWNDIKIILWQHEEISQENCSTLQQISTKLGDLEHAMVSLTQKMDEMEFEIQ
jgi:hypothetical protein